MKKLNVDMIKTRAAFSLYRPQTSKKNHEGARSDQEKRLTAPSQRETPPHLSGGSTELLNMTRFP